MSDLDSKLDYHEAANLLSSGDNSAGISVFHSKASSSVQLVQPMSKLVTVKLEDGNYLTWKQQVLTAIGEYGLEDFLIGTSIVPSQFVNGESGEPIHNLEFVAHQHQDQLLVVASLLN